MLHNDATQRETLPAYQRAMRNVCYRKFMILLRIDFINRSFLGGIRKLPRQGGSLGPDAKTSCYNLLIILIIFSSAPLYRRETIQDFHYVWAHS